MNLHTQTLSLIPFLKSGEGRVSLHLSSELTADEHTEGQLGSFVPDYSYDYLSFGFSAELRSDSGYLIRRIMLLIQRDYYSAFTTQKIPYITNKTVEDCWNKADQLHQDSGTGLHRIVFSEHIGKEKEFLPFASLFFCKRKEVYFHPPCSRCGSMLQVCRDDVLLEKFKLSLYSKSLRRYLFCPDCTPQFGDPWYVKTDTLHKEISIVRTSNQLINDFGLITSTTHPELHFPCLDCSDKQECYGESGRALAFIKTVSFYPFYMLMVQDISFSGFDFIALISGASVEQLIDYKQKRGFGTGLHFKESLEKCILSDCYFYAKEDPCHFVEVLYLKVVFLSKIAEYFDLEYSIGDASCNYLPISTVGVSINGQGVSPWFLNYSLFYPGLDKYLNEGGPASQKPSRPQMYYFGLLWFVVLLMNENQEEYEIIDKIDTLLKREKYQEITPSMLEQIFHPAQVFWSDHYKSSDSHYWKFWEEILSTGAQILNAGNIHDNQGQLDIFPLVESCLKDLKIQVFAPARPELTRSYPSENLEISNILNDIKSTWMLVENELTDSNKNLGATAHTSVRNTSMSAHQISDEEYDPEKTVILSDYSRDTLMADSDTTEIVNDFAEQTILIKSGGFKPVAHADQQTEKSEKDNRWRNENGLDETVVVKVSNPQREHSVIKEGNSSGENILAGDINPSIDELEETIQGNTDQSMTFIEEQGSKDSDDEAFDLEKTVAIKNGPAVTDGINNNNKHHGQPGKEKFLGDDEDDFLTETIVLKPSDSKKLR